MTQVDEMGDIDSDPSLLPEFPKLQLSEAARNFELNDLSALDRDQFDSYRVLSYLDQVKLLLTWPLPALYRSYSLAPSDDSWNYDDLDLTANLHNFRKIPSDKNFVIDDTKFDIKETLLFDLLKHNIHLSKENSLTRQKFKSEYVEDYLNNANLGDDDFTRYLGSRDNAFSQWQRMDCQNDTGIRHALEETLFFPVNPLLNVNFKRYSEEIQSNVIDEISNKRYLKPVFDDAKPELDTRLYATTSRFSTAFLGLKAYPNLQAGYFGLFSEPPRLLPLFLSGIGEFKYCSFHLESCVQEILHCNKWHFSSQELKDQGKEESEIEELERTQSRVKELDDTLYEYTTLSVHLGTPRYIITDYKGFLFVNLHFEEEEPPEGYGTSLTERHNHIKADYAYFSKNEPNIRLLVVAFLAISRKLIDETKLFREAINQMLKKSMDLILSQQLKDSSMDISSFNSICNQMEEAKESNESSPIHKRRLRSSVDRNDQMASTYKRGRTSISYDSHQSLDHCTIKHNQPIKFNKNNFKDNSYVELGDVISEIITEGSQISQVVKVDSRKFLKAIPKQNICFQDDLPETTILKVFDPYLGHYTKDVPDRFDPIVLHYGYQESIDFTVAEAKAYCALSEFSGDFLPRIYSYGRLSDIRPCVGELYLRLFGGYILIEALEKVENFPMTMEFFEEKVVTAFRKMHSRNVIHNAVDMENLYVTEAGDFKVINFRCSTFSTSEEEKKAEMDLVYKRFRKSR